MKKLLLLSVSLPSLVAADLAIAQQQGQADDTITVIGSRVKGRTALDSAVPVDVVQVGELKATPSLNIKDAVQAVSPSFVVDRSAVGDGNTLIRSTSLRGLNSGEVLVLVNNKRVHRSAILIGGYQTADIGTYTTNSIKNISVLRDGAAAQYGADAVAGVINLTLDDSEGISGEASYSKYYAGDGTQYSVASKVGLNLADRGFLTISAQYGHTDPTDRATTHASATHHIARYAEQEAFIAEAIRSGNVANRAGALTAPGGWYDTIGGQFEFNDPGDLNPDTIAPFGLAEESSFNITWNAEMEVGENSSVYTFGNFSRRHVKEPFNYRAGLPNDPNNVRYDGGGGRRNAGASARVEFTFADYAELFGIAQANANEYLLTDRRQFDNSVATFDASGNSIVNYIDANGDNIAPIFDANGVAIVGSTPGGSGLDNAYEANPNGGFAGLGVHPNGFNPWFEIDSKDVGSYVGFKGEFDNGLTYDLSGSLGRNRVDYSISDTLNASNGAPKAADGSIDYANAQTAFYIGALVNIERSVGLDFTYEVDQDAVDALNIAFGTEYRSDQYYKIAGEEASWSPGPLAGPGGVNVGSDGFGGFSPANVTDDSRHNYALYVDVEADVTEDFNIGVAARYEDFSDFGDNLSWKVATRYQLMPDLLAIRGAASTGFHAPSIGQINNTQVATNFEPDGTQTQVGTFPADSELASFFSAQPLRPELARNLSAGFIFTPGDNTNITVDIFQIKLLDRISNSRNFERDDFPNEFAALETSQPSASSLTRVRFFTNSYDTKTRGIEVVATHNLEFDNSSLRMTLAYAHVDTQVTRYDPATTSLQTVFNREHTTTPHRGTFTASWNADALTVTGRARYFGSQKQDRRIGLNGEAIGDNTLPRRIDTNPGKVFFDLSVQYEIDDQFSVTVGADNILNTFPTKQPGIVQVNQLRGRQFLEGFDWQGGSYYARVKASF